MQAGFIARTMAYNTALVTLELALLAERGETAEVLALAKSGTPPPSPWSPKAGCCPVAGQEENS